MTGLKRIGSAFVFATVMSGGVLISTPAEALPGAVCNRLALAIETLTDLAAQYPDNQLIAAFLERAIDAYQNHCQ
jgi:hypothetical protein